MDFTEPFEDCTNKNKRDSSMSGKENQITELKWFYSA